MNIAKKSLEELVDTEIMQLRKEVEERTARDAGYAVHIINERHAALRAAIEVRSQVDRNDPCDSFLRDAEFLAIVDKEIYGDFDGGVLVELRGEHTNIEMSQPKQGARPWESGSRRKYRFVVAAIPLEEKKL